MSDPAALKLSNFLPFRLSALSNTISRNIASVYDREFGLTIWQWRVMSVVGESGRITATEVTVKTAMDKVAVSRAVAGLMDLGYVERRASQLDGRRSLLFLSDAGRQAYDEIVPMALAYESNLTDALSAAERKTLDELLDKLGKVASPDRPLW